MNATGRNGNSMAVAAHESGHAVAMVLAGLFFEHVTARRHDDMLGHVEFVDEPDEPHERGRLAFVYTAGPVAEAIYARRAMAKVWMSDGSSGDAIEVARLAPNGDEFLSLVREARAALRRHWPAVMRVAGRLHQGATLTFQDVEDEIRPPAKEAA